MHRPCACAWREPQISTGACAWAVRTAVALVLRIVQITISYYLWYSRTVLVRYCTRLLVVLDLVLVLVARSTIYSTTVSTISSTIYSL
jgi:hypothetical protein